MDFILGCNYWASHSGTDMWINWDGEIVNEDLKILSENGVEYLRVFPLWRDFQPVIPMYDSNKLYEYRLAGESYTNNSYYLDENMMQRFEKFCIIAQKYNIKLIVGLITGWMSGRLFVPPALYGKNPITDTTAIMFEQKFIKGFVKYFKNTINIYAWDLGNECNCMGIRNSREEAYAWSAMITNAIKAEDNTRMVISGMHSLECEQGWTIQDQGEITDMLTTHPYPLWVQHCSVDPINSTRTLLHATAQSEYYSSIGNKPCLVEEIGTMGPMVCSEEIGGDFMRVNLFSNFSNGATGLMWWCANEQSNLKTAPYDWNMCERELGLLDINMKPKPALLEMKKFADFLKDSKINLSKSKKDAVCILSKGQDHWGIAYMSYVLAKQSGINLTFAYANDEIQQSDCYLLPSVNGNLIMSKRRYDELKKQIFKGATLYISLSDCILSEFQELTSTKVITTQNSDKSYCINLNDKNIEYFFKKRINIENIDAEVLAYDDTGMPSFTCGKYGKGKVYMLNFPVEEILLNEPNMTDGNYYEIIKTVCGDILDNKIVTTDNKYIGLTEHLSKDGIYYIAVNYSSRAQIPDFKINENYEIIEILYGDVKKIKACDAVVYKISCDKKNLNYR